MNFILYFISFIFNYINQDQKPLTTINYSTSNSAILSSLSPSDFNYLSQSSQQSSETYSESLTQKNRSIGSDLTTLNPFSGKNNTFTTLSTENTTKFASTQLISSTTFASTQLISATTSASTQPKITNKIQETSTEIINKQCSFVLNSASNSKSCKYGFTGSYCDECGLRFTSPNVKIVGGQEAVPHSWPSMAYIVFNYRGYFKLSNGQTILGSIITGSCGGTLIDRETVLTASHCFVEEISYSYLFRRYSVKVEPNEFYPTYESMYTVYLGLHSIDNLSTSKKFALKKFLRHEKYDDYTTLNDIAMLKLIKPVELDCNIQPACLPNPAIANYPNKTNVNVWAAGWGRLFDLGPLPSVLNNVVMTLYDPTLCADVSYGIKKDWNTQLCAGEYSGGKDTCQGDSGGPLFLLDNVNGKNKFILIGITSYGDGCADPGFPGIYTKVSAFLDWIKKNS